jgi:hypothetical protein
MMTKNELIDLLCVNAYAVYNACIVGNPCKKVEDMMTFQNGNPDFRREQLHPGEMVMEISSIWNRWNNNRIGYLISDQDEYRYTDEEWNNDAELRAEWDNERPKQRYVRIKRLSDGEEQRWENCQFIRVFTVLDELRGRD